MSAAGTGRLGVAGCLHALGAHPANGAMSDSGVMPYAMRSMAVALTTSRKKPSHQRHRRQSDSSPSRRSDDSFISSIPAAEEKLRRRAGQLSLAKTAGC